MANRSVEKMIPAYGKGGKQRLTPESQVVYVKSVGVAIDMDGGTPCTPRIRRALFCEGIDHLPSRLIKIDPPGTVRTKLVVEEQPDGKLAYVNRLVPLNHWSVELEYPEPSARNLAGCGTNRSFVAVTCEADARDPYFANLPKADRDSIVAAVMS